MPIAIACLLFCLFALGSALPLAPALAAPPEPSASSSQSPRLSAWEPLLNRLAADGFERGDLERLFSRPGVAYDPNAMVHKLRALYKSKYGPKPQGPAPEIFPSCLAPERIAEAKAFKREHGQALRQVRARWGVPEDIAVGLLSVETRVGHYLGEGPAFASLASMAATPDARRLAPLLADLDLSSEQSSYLASRARDKADWAYGELKALIRYARRCDKDPTTLPGSAYGAIGVCQFMPSNALRLAVDGDGDGKADLFNPVDALHSLGSYLKASGLNPAEPATIRKSLYAYNHSQAYVNTILAVAERLRDEP